MGQGRWNVELENGPGPGIWWSVRDIVGQASSRELHTGPRHTPNSGVIFISPDGGPGVDQFIHRGGHGSSLRGAVPQGGSTAER
jgi:hypothetical protein